MKNVFQRIFQAPNIRYLTSTPWTTGLYLYVNQNTVSQQLQIEENLTKKTNNDTVFHVTLFQISSFE